MITHQTRIILITIMLATSVLGLVIMASLGEAEGTAFGVLIGLVSTLAPAFFDALGVKRRGALILPGKPSAHAPNAADGEDAGAENARDHSLTDEEQELLEDRR